eukprot:gnl/MRDRNA2_/MRDRNA2_33600_c0_seq2.p1 gnl/MRDRNA2_/MRDRNA2_33600_c0~~gnl/MRDRNA2_/MRDRNA2_33600_c0_seq2.p1  ORF type:complete len:112 (-),score=34.37 gnl/MRDRNA2_/MRDRNA2_33600_c0_seq2:15-350(-)
MQSLLIAWAVLSALGVSHAAPLRPVALLKGRSLESSTESPTQADKEYQAQAEEDLKDRRESAAKAETRMPPPPRVSDGAKSILPTVDPKYNGASLGKLASSVLTVLMLTNL